MNEKQVKFIFSFFFLPCPLDLQEVCIARAEFPVLNLFMRYKFI